MDSGATGSPGMTGLGNGIINALLTASGYDASAAVQNAGVQTMLVVCYLAIELICYAAIVVLMGFLKVEKHVKADQQIILEHQKKAVLAAGGQWIEPEERLRMEACGRGGPQRGIKGVLPKERLKLRAGRRKISEKAC